MTLKPTMTLYGIKTCDTVKKARTWLDSHGLAHAFHDYRAEGIDRQRLAGWAKEVGWQVLLNRTSTTFRALPEADKADIDEEKAIALMLAEPTMIKRPVLDLGDRRIVGFKPDVYAAALKA